MIMNELFLLTHRLICIRSIRRKNRFTELETLISRNGFTDPTPSGSGRVISFQSKILKNLSFRIKFLRRIKFYVSRTNSVKYIAANRAGRRGGIGGKSPPLSREEKAKNCFKNAWKCVKFQKIFACGAYRHRRKHQTFSIIEAKFFIFCGDERKICHFSRLRRKIFATKIFYQNFSIIPPWRQGLRPALFSIKFKRLLGSLVTGLS